MAGTGRRMKGTVRSPGMVVLLSIVTCGLYLVNWYFKTLDEMREAGFAATGNSTMVDFLLTLLACSIYGIYVDYRISKALVAMQQGAGLPVNDVSLIVIILDVFGFTVITSAIHQSELNKIWTKAAAM
jgi:hypothetical protein